jgi:hypothetical protein
LKADPSFNLWQSSQVAFPIGQGFASGDRRA